MVAWVGVRFTPTGVGKMKENKSLRILSSVHPHRRGENVYADQYAQEGRGSPPQAWGKCGHKDHALDTVRFTPTGVGKIRDPK